MKIAILAYLEPDAAEPDVVMPQVAAALEAAGHDTEVITIQNDAARLIADLKQLKPDLVFNLVESFGADILGGVMGVAGVLDLIEIPYTGGGPGELYLQEDKSLAKKLLAYEGVPSPDFAAFAPDADFETGGNLRMPLFVKPMRMESSLGIDEKSLVHNTQELMERVLHIHKAFGDAALAEEFVDGREFYVGVIGNQRPTVFPPIEMDFSGLPAGGMRIMDNQAKFAEGSERFEGTKAVVAEIEPELRARLHKVALSAYRALRVRDYGRIDLRLAESGEIYVIEVNANCYLEQNGEFAMSARAAGVDYNGLIGQIVDLAVERGKQRTKAHGRRKRTIAKAASKEVTAE